MKKYLFLTIAILASTYMSAQNSDKAKALLDEVYTKVSGYENIFVDFRFELKNTDADINSETRGTVTLAGDKYLGDLFGTKQLYDGNMVYTIIPENEEVMIEAKADNENTFTPTKMLTFYKEGHTYGWDI